ncbi:uncharacterized protein PFL1_01507 [Pseudozyma flocculosa PF-1]|uniref:uncharacterized protein n=1 Tax=Pseudozyma flocculosa PF-1 TaxID=1277687 RepID=UPI0004560FD5|nr:uncharacterized protein PFL1_01507 [Pseudozyma flocculosa PF-1]EPQ31323.1 hypothetical protein PFL1_01507 [Pseudozyma flocculosa PF-1]
MPNPIPCPDHDGGGGLDCSPLSHLFYQVRTDASPHSGPSPFITLLSTFDAASSSRWTLSAHTACFTTDLLPLPTSPGELAEIVAAFTPHASALSVSVPSKVALLPPHRWSRIGIHVDIASPDASWPRLRAYRVEGQHAIDLAGRAMVSMHTAAIPQTPTSEVHGLRIALDQARAAHRQDLDKYRRLLSSSSTMAPTSRPVGIAGGAASLSQRGLLANSDLVPPSSAPTSVAGSSNDGSPPAKKLRTRDQHSESPSAARRGRWIGSLVNPARVFRDKPGENDDFVDPDETL